MITEIADARRFVRLRERLGADAAGLTLRDNATVSLPLADLESLLNRFDEVLGNPALLARPMDRADDRCAVVTSRGAPGAETRRAECPACHWDTGWYADGLWGLVAGAGEQHNTESHHGEKAQSTCTRCDQRIEHVNTLWQHEDGLRACGAPYPALPAEPARKDVRR